MAPLCMYDNAYLLQGELVLEPQQAVVLDQLDKTVIVQRVFCEIVKVACTLAIGGAEPFNGMGGQFLYPGGQLAFQVVAGDYRHCSYCIGYGLSKSSVPGKSSSHKRPGLAR